MIGVLGCSILPSLIDVKITPQAIATIPIGGVQYHLEKTQQDNGYS